MTKLLKGVINMKDFNSLKIGAKFVLIDKESNLIKAKKVNKTQAKFKSIVGGFVIESIPLERKILKI